MDTPSIEPERSSLPELLEEAKTALERIATLHEAQPDRYYGTAVHTVARRRPTRRRGRREAEAEPQR